VIGLVRLTIIPVYRIHMVVWENRSSLTKARAGRRAKQAVASEITGLYREAPDHFGNRWQLIVQDESPARLSTLAFLSRLRGQPSALGRSP